MATTSSKTVTPSVGDVITILTTDGKDDPNKYTVVKVEGPVLSLRNNSTNKITPCNVARLKTIIGVIDNDDKVEDMVKEEAVAAKAPVKKVVSITKTVTPAQDDSAELAAESTSESAESDSTVEEAVQDAVEGVSSEEAQSDSETEAGDNTEVAEAAPAKKPAPKPASPKPASKTPAPKPAPVKKATESQKYDVQPLIDEGNEVWVKDCEFPSNDMEVKAYAVITSDESEFYTFNTYNGCLTANGKPRKNDPVRYQFKDASAINKKRSKLTKDGYTKLG